MLTCFPGIWGPLPKILPVLAHALEAQGCKVVMEPWGRHREGESVFEKMLGRLRDIARVRRRCLIEHFDVMVVHTTTEMVNYSRDIPIVWLCRGVVGNVVLHFHGSTPRTALEPGHAAFKRASAMLLRLVDGVLVLSSEEQREWAQFHPEGRFLLVTNPFESFRPGAGEPTPASWHVPPGIPLLLYAGRITKEKGVFDLLEALSLMRGQTPFHLLVAGGGTEEQAFRERVRILGLQGKVTMAGYLNHEALCRAYRSADLFVFPSWREGFPTVITEAMDAGLPIVTTYIRGAVDHLREGVHACFVPPQNPAALAQTIERVLGSLEMRESMGKANRAKVKEFAPEIVGAQYLKLLGEIAASKQGQVRQFRPPTVQNAKASMN